MRRSKLAVTSRRAQTRVLSSCRFASRFTCYATHLVEDVESALAGSVRDDAGLLEEVVVGVASDHSEVVGYGRARESNFHPLAEARRVVVADSLGVAECFENCHKHGVNTRHKHATNTPQTRHKHATNTPQTRCEQGVNKDKQGVNKGGA